MVNQQINGLSDKSRLLTRSPIDRMQRIFHTIKSKRFPNRVSLSQDIEVITKTIQRDINFMRNRLRLPIIYSKHYRCYQLIRELDNDELELHLILSYLIEIEPWGSKLRVPRESIKP